MFEYPNQFYRYVYGDKKRNVLVLFIAILLAIYRHNYSDESYRHPVWTNDEIFTDFSKNRCFSDNSIHTKNSHRHRFIAIIMAIKIIAIRSEPTFIVCKKNHMMTSSNKNSNYPNGFASSLPNPRIFIGQNRAEQKGKENMQWRQSYRVVFIIQTYYKDQTINTNLTLFAMCEGGRGGGVDFFLILF